jgi:hypothetical protein
VHVDDSEGGLGGQGDGGDQSLEVLDIESDLLLLNEVIFDLLEGSWCWYEEVVLSLKIELGESKVLNAILIVGWGLLDNLNFLWLFDLGWSSNLSFGGWFGSWGSLGLFWLRLLLGIPLSLLGWLLGAFLGVVLLFVISGLFLGS